MSERKRIIPAERSIIVAADVEPEQFPRLVRNIYGIEGVSGVKVGFEVAFGGLKEAVKIAKADYSDLIPTEELVVIYDHQKAGNDIDATGKNFARAMQRAEVDAAILFPFTGPEVQKRWTAELQDREIGVIVGAEMTHPGFLRSEGGRIADDTLGQIFVQAINDGVRDFVLPGNKPDKVRGYRKMFEELLGEGNFDVYSPGLVAQGGTISEAGKAAGRNFHGIVGRGIVAAANVRLAAIEHTSEILGN